MLYVVSDIEHTIMFKFLDRSLDNQEGTAKVRGSTKCDEIPIFRYSQMIQIDDLRNLLEVWRERGTLIPCAFLRGDSYSH